MERIGKGAVLVAAIAMSAGPAAAANSACTGSVGTFADPAEGTTSPSTDFTAFSWSVAGSTVTIGTTVPQLAYQVEVDRPGIQGAFQEYAWGVAIDVDGNTLTGQATHFFYGADYQLSVSYFHQSSIPRLLSLEDMQHDLWRYNPTSGSLTSTSPRPSFARNFGPTYLELSANVPGVSPNSRLIPFTAWYDPAISGSRMDLLTDCVHLTTVRVFRGGFEH